MVRFNLKIFVEEFKIARESGDLDAEADLLESFNKFFNSTNSTVRTSVQTYLFNNQIARQYTDLQDIATRCITNF